MSCRKAVSSPLAGTAWECVEDGSVWKFNDDHSGLFYCKSFVDDVYDEIFSSFDFIYEISGNQIKAKVSFSRQTVLYHLTLQDEDTIMAGVYHYKKIRHKVSERTD